MSDTGTSQRSATERVMFLTHYKAQFDQHQAAVYNSGTSGYCGCAFCADFLREREIQRLEKALRR